MARLAIEAEGIVQGVGMRPFVHRAAVARGLVGWVRNGTGAVRIEVQGARSQLRAFVEILAHGCPPPASIERMAVTEVDERDEQTFRILESAREQDVRPAIPADLAICAECEAEMDTPGARRYRYPFTNCARCGPRFTIVEALPYDRPQTSMKAFTMCTECAAEYASPLDRRFHAQPIACPACGPSLTLLAAEGSPRAHGDEALRLAAAAVRAGQALALKGIGGFQLVVDATNARAVRGLRERKQRQTKPFAVMFPSLDAVRRCCKVSLEEERTLASPAAPILLLKREGDALAEGVAPDNPRIGAMLPYSPLHRLLLRETGCPLVCTSGNLSDEPMCVNEEEALTRLRGIADLFLVHDRPVVRPADDSVGRMGANGLELVRRARGYAPLPIRLREPTPVVLALGAHLKSTVALAIGKQAVVSQHLGDLHSVEGARLIDRTARELTAFFGVRPELIACDLHPDYASTRLAERLAASWEVPLARVQHHHAHVAACMAEHGLAGPVLGVAWDGAGYGEDGTIWGGEFLLCEGSRAHRVAHLRSFTLPGGEAAMREPSRAALGVLHEVMGGHVADHARAWFTPTDAAVLIAMMSRSFQAPRTTSVGRLFDAVAALAGLHAKNHFEGEAAMALEFAAEGFGRADPYPITLGPGDPAVADWEPLIGAVLDDVGRGVPLGAVSARFHEALAALAEDVAVRVGTPRVVLSGGCFQNVRLAHRTRERLTVRGFDVHTPRLFPPNDGGISLGQVLVASRRCADGGASCA